MVNAPRSEKTGMHPAPGHPAPEWRIARAAVPYPDALAVMNARVAAIVAGEARELVWLLEHPPLYTAGTSAVGSDLRSPPFPVFEAGRGGQYTYHGPGQRVVYVMLDLKRRGTDVRRFVASLEAWLIRTLAVFGAAGERRQDRVGVWVRRPDKGPLHEDKVAAIGIRLRRFVSLHGISLNVAPDLSHFGGVVPCGVHDPRFGVTSLSDLGINVGQAVVDAALRREFENLFGPTDASDVTNAAGAADELAG